MKEEVVIIVFNFLYEYQKKNFLIIFNRFHIELILVNIMEKEIIKKIKEFIINIKCI